MTNTPNPYTDLMPKHVHDANADLLDELVFDRCVALKPDFNLDTSEDERLYDEQFKLALIALYHEIAPFVEVSIKWHDGNVSTMVADELPK